MQTLVEGAHYFQNIGFKQQEKLFTRLANEQKPVACFITCSDSRIDPNLITNAQPGQLFIVRNVGNIVPCYGTSNNGEMAAVEFAVTALGVKDIIVCGHTPCGAMKALLNPASLSELPSVQSWLRHADATTAIMREHYTHLHDDQLATATAEENVLVQLEHLRTLPSVASRVTRGLLGLHGWMYKIGTGEIYAYDADAKQFVKFGSAGRPGTNGAAEKSGAGKNAAANGGAKNGTPQFSSK
jgi:carbonic anhydrase